MAAFDPQQQRMCVRIVYDGVASAGKTTNLRQLAELFATQRTCELFCPAEMGGRTLYFDWLQIAAGMACGFPLLCQVITVPGQIVLTARRRHLLSTADAVVHVCDSEALAIGRAIEGLAVFDEVERAGGRQVPLVLQANKQDQPGALSGPALLTALGRTGAPVVEAIASDGIGVVDTFVSAVRAVVRAIQARVDAGDVRVPLRPADRASAILERLAVEEVDPEWAIEMMLEEASNAFAAGGLLGENEADDRDPPTWRPPRAGPVPVLPTEHVPTGFVWPAHTGRAALRALSVEAQMRKVVALDHEGVARLVLGGSELCTRHDLRFASSEVARQALVRAARERAQLGSLLAPETVLVVQPADDDSSWLWTIVPRLPTIMQLVEGGADADAPSSAVLEAFGGALVDALKVEAVYGMTLDLSPRAFGLRQGAVRYLGEVAVGGASGRDARGAITEALRELTEVCDELDPVLRALEAGIAAKLSHEELTRLARVEPAAEPPPAPLVDARRRLDEAFRRGRRAA